ncbi:MAG: SCP-like extracellular, partial [bacterium]|nr:SCP-like extracellular [bacterium]
MRLLALVVLLPSLSWAQAVRYNDASPAASTASRPPLAQRIDELVARVAKSQRRQVPRPDARLDAAATELLRVASQSDAPPNELVQGALWVHGIVEPSPQLILTAMGPGGDEELLRAVANDLPKVLADGRFARVGVGLAAARGGETRVLVALQESFVELDPIARAQPLGANVLLRGRLHEGFQRPEAFVTAPDGTVSSRVPIGGDSVRFGGNFRCGPQKGRYQIEVTGEDRFGSTVVANFPVWCGTAAPMTAAAASPAGAG